jgi:hypothetical protein
MGDVNRKLTFGIYPGGAAGGDAGILSGPSDDLEEIKLCLDRLQGNSRLFVVRCYDSFQDPDSPLWNHPSAPVNYAAYASTPKRPIELVLQFRSASGDIAGYLEFVRGRIKQHAQILHSVQITEESNITNGPNVIDGYYPEVLTALVEGVRVARETLREIGREDVKIGFSITPTFGPAAEYWTRLRNTSTDQFSENIDYVGLDFFPDTFHPIPSEKLASTVLAVLKTLRNEWMPAARIPERVSISITEHGWPTGPSRTFERQAQVIEEVVSCIFANRESLNIDRYSLFALRDVDFSTPETEQNVFRFFGITTADYRPKPAFHTYVDLIGRFGGGTQV